MGDIADVLVGVAKLFVRQPNDAIAEWDAKVAHAGSHSVKLHKGGSGNEGSTHLEIIPPTGITMTLWTAGITAGKYSYWHICSALTANFSQFEFKFEDPNSKAWAEITAVPNQSYDGSIGGVGPNWVQVLLADGDKCGYGGHTELDTPFFQWGLGAGDILSGVEALIAALDAAACTPGDWILTRVRIELWEPSVERTEWIDSVTIDGVLYTIEPGGDAPGMSLSSPFVEVGYTEDGVSWDYTVDESDINVEEETFPIGREITREGLAVTCNMAESSLANIANAMAGSVLTGSKLTLGGGVNKKMNIKIVGISPKGFHRTIYMPLVTATGAVSMSYRKGTKVIVPVTFTALKGDGEVFTIADNEA